MWAAIERCAGRMPIQTPVPSGTFGVRSPSKNGSEQQPVRRRAPPTRPPPRGRRGRGRTASAPSRWPPSRSSCRPAAASARSRRRTAATSPAGSTTGRVGAGVDRARGPEAGRDDAVAHVAGADGAHHVVAAARDDDVAAEAATAREFRRTTPAGSRELTRRAGSLPASSGIDRRHRLGATTSRAHVHQRGAGGVAPFHVRACPSARRPGSRAAAAPSRAGRSCSGSCSFSQRIFDAVKPAGMRVARAVRSSASARRGRAHDRVALRRGRTCRTRASPAG